VKSFPNTYLGYFSAAAFEMKIAYITNFYTNFDGDLDREYPFMSKADMNNFVEIAAAEIRPKIHSIVGLSNAR
jgi:hypothetical protein